MIPFVLRVAREVLVRKSQSRTMVFPAEYLSLLRREVEEQLGLDPKTKKPPFISDSDIITAWCSSIITRSCSDGRPATIACLFNLRGRLSDTLSAEGLYLQNLLSSVNTVLSPAETSSSTLGQIALRVRESVAEQTTDTQSRSIVRLWRAWASIGVPPPFGSSNTMIIGSTNWTKFRFREAANFSPAVIHSGAGDEKSGVPPGSCVSCFGTLLGDHYTKRNMFIIYGKDVGGGYSVHGFLREKTWDLIREEFSRYA